MELSKAETHRVLGEREGGVPPTLPEARPVLEELLHLKDDLVVDEAEEDGDNHPLKVVEVSVGVILQGK